MCFVYAVYGLPSMSFVVPVFTLDVMGLTKLIKFISAAVMYAFFTISFLYIPKQILYKTS